MCGIKNDGHEAAIKKNTTDFKNYMCDCVLADIMEKLLKLFDEGNRSGRRNNIHNRGVSRTANKEYSFSNTSGENKAGKNVRISTLFIYKMG